MSTSPRSQPTGARPDLIMAIALVVVSWASAFAGIRAGLQAYSPTHLALLRYLFASAVLIVYAVVTGMRLPRLRDLPALVALGAVGISYYNIALAYGQITVAAATASFLVSTAPAWMALLARVLFREHLSTLGWAGIAVSLAGVAVIALGNAGALEFAPHALIVLSTAVAASIYSLGQKPYLRRYSALQCTTYAIWGGTLIMLPLGGGLIAEVRAAPPGATWAVAYLGIVPGALGYVMWLYALARVPAATAGSFLYLIPALALIIAWLWLGEVPSLISLVGGVLVIAGVVLVNRWGRSRSLPPSTISDSRPH